MQAQAQCHLQLNSRLPGTMYAAADIHKPQPTCVAAIKISPFLGVHRLLTTPMSWMASVRASSVWGTCRFISSPSKSAL